ncbi:hypothetical protein [Actinospongicola halichondriae]|uniref:hypothetical protein n=1 Tax=Actinospongicola halichondriae TaxID=3236844 RepID=UPI003D4EA4F3
MSRSTDIAGWFHGRVDDGWFTDLEVRTDKEEVLVVGTLATPKLGKGDGDDARRVAASARINGFREDTRERRIVIANEAEHLFGKKVSWGARCDGLERRFTVANVPVMTRLLFDERQVLDTLIDAGIARSRSEALAWCVKLVGANQAEWIEALRVAVADVEKVRAEGPSV